MDSLTHIALGAGVGALLGGRSLGRKALVWGAVAQSLPDIDFLAGLWCDPAEDLLAHRGFTHSFLCIVLVAPLLALAAARLYTSPGYSYKRWLLFFFLQLLIHLLLDGLNVYGTGWWEPFSHTRLSGNLLFVADPLFTIPLLIAAVWLFFTIVPTRKLSFRPVLVAFSICSLYLLAALVSKRSVEKKLLDTCQKRGIASSRFFTTPAPFTSFLWYCVVAADRGFYVGYHSVFDRSDELSLSYVPQQDSLLSPVHDREDVQHLRRFSQGYYVLQNLGDSLVFSDLRFGQQMGWVRPQAPFSFYYFLEHPGQNNFLIQRGRIAGWNRSNFIDYARLVFGRQ
ncbi:MAG: metal-dependent hydrolase [Chitinophagia bacterium]|nr:metal-dependent hydrolase [Chitinophagia bacterium]